MSRIAYISFDKVPAPKGAATHIEAFVKVLSREFGGVDLVTVSQDASPAGPVERWPGVFHSELPAQGPTLIDRVLGFRQYLTRWLAPREFEVIHFRSIFEGGPILAARKRARLIFEVNGLHSIELKYHYPRCQDDRELMTKFIAQERACLHAADHIVTPSAVTAKFLGEQRGAILDKISMIPNGVDLEVFRPMPGTEHTARLLYFGTLAAWQGVELAIRALPSIRARADASLTILGFGSHRRRAALARLAEKLRVGSFVEIGDAVSQQELVERMAQSGIVLAPLLWNDRNVVQGCCPLKILEAMACAKPVLTSDLAVTRELGRNEEHFLLVKPGSVDELASAAIRLLEDPAQAARLGSNARAHVERNYSWTRAGAELAALYEAAGASRAITA